MEKFTPYILATAAALLSLFVYIITHLHSQDTRLAVIESFIKGGTQDAARMLNRPNPAPADIRQLLDKHIHGEKLEGEDRTVLVEWLKKVGSDPNSQDRGPALRMLRGVMTIEEMPKRKHWWWPFDSFNC